MSQQLRRGARQSLDYIYERLTDAEAIARRTNDLELQRLMLEALREMQRELEPMLQRAGPNEPTIDMRVRALEADVARLNETVSAFFQNAAQHI